MFRCETSEKDFKNREESFQLDLENASLNESKLHERCDELETLYHDTRRQKDEQHFELTQVVERANALEQRVKEVEDEKTDLEFDLCALRNALCRHVKVHEKNEMDSMGCECLFIYFLFITLFVYDGYVMIYVRNILMRLKSSY